VHILVVHNRYRAANPSGENVVVDSEIDALRAAGHQVTTYLRSSDEVDRMSLPQRVAHVGSPVHSGRAVRDIETMIDTDRPDILHLHNPYPLVSMSVVAAAKGRGVPCVQTVHNHRHTCMKGTYQRDGNDCRDCLRAGHPGPGVAHGCYRSSRLQSAVMAAALLRSRRAYRDLDRLIALTPEIVRSLTESGFEEARISLRPNSVPDPGPATPPGRGVTFVGRLSREKGILALAEAWARVPDGTLGPLRIVGSGPDGDAVRRVADGRSDVQVLGQLDTAGVRDAIAASAIVVVPSLWPEAFPLVLLEAMSAGRGLLVTDQGGLPTIVTEEIGRVVRPDVSSIAAGLRALAGDADLVARLGRAARTRYEERYHPEIALARLAEIYAEVIASHRAAS
jgi:glycosyltransferase involved in cell wall biosynthesis